MKNSHRIAGLLEEAADLIRQESEKGEDPKPRRFKKLSDGWVQDKELGLDWGPSSSARMVFAAANKYASKDGGRLPTSKELMSLIDHARNDPAIDTDFFIDTNTDDWYWTGTTVAGNSDVAWCVNFSYGSVNGLHKDYDNYVRPVRPSQ